MFRPTLPAAALIACCLWGCKNGNLAAREASTALAKSLFAPENSVQTLSLVTGDSRTPRADALNVFLYAKHWLTCKDTQPGIFSRVAVCTLNAAGRTFGQENGWTKRDDVATCAQCELWTVPLARATLRSVTGVAASGKNHAVVTYAYDVTPNAFGGELGDWMGTNPVAWCGTDPRAVGAWAQARSGTANFARTGGMWAPSQPPAGFTQTFGAPAAERACPT
jgi:hypothetical protein